MIMRGVVLGKVNRGIDSAVLLKDVSLLACPSPNLVFHFDE